ncbi:hypothetical protein L208DRAFT_1514844 [Tricholoma matsutake]|nr:hypothetical protein L208DRAFT_1514844 [Tricholoma matsutake 945]
MLAYEDEDLDGLYKVKIEGDGEESEDREEDEEEGEGVETVSKTETPETILELAYIWDPKLFDRDAGTRRSKAREELRVQTGWGDEQIGASCDVVCHFGGSRLGTVVVSFRRWWHWLCACSA